MIGEKLMVQVLGWACGLLLVLAGALAVATAYYRGEAHTARAEAGTAKGEAEQLRAATAGAATRVGLLTGELATCEAGKVRMRGENDAAVVELGRRVAAADARAAGYAARLEGARQNASCAVLLESDLCPEVMGY